MLNNDGRTLRIIEVKTPSPLSSSADRSINEDEEIVGKTESSSGGSSPSDLKKRLQHHPSPNEVTRLANRVININRRLSRKRDFYFHGATSRIEENVETEETEEQETVSSRKSHSDLKAKDARARRRAKIRSDHDREERMMVISKPSDTSDVKNESSNSQRSNNSSLIERKFEQISAKSSERQLGIEMLSNNAQQYSSLSARSSTTSGLYRNQQDEINNDSSRSQRNDLRICSNTSCEDFSKARLDLQPGSSPVSLKSSSHSRYRPCRGVILQNLSSGSEAESNYEVMSDRIGPNENMEHFATEQTNIFSMNVPTIRNLNDNLPAKPLSSRRSSNHIACNSSRSNYLEDIVASPVPRVDFTENKFRPSLINPVTSASLSSARRITHDRSFYRVLDSSRSDCTHDMKSTVKQLVEEPLFFSAREGIRDCDRKEEFSLLAGSPCTDISPRNLDARVPKHVSRHNLMNLKRNAYSEDGFDHREIPTNEYSYPSNSVLCENQTCTSTPTGIRLPETIPESPTFEYPPSNNSEPYLSRVTNRNALKEAISKCILSYDSQNEVKVTQLQNFTPALQFQASASENQSTASTFREFHAGDSTKSAEENLYSSESSRNDQEARNQQSSKIISDKEFVHVPTLVLNSREVSYCSSPISKPCSEKRLDADTLIMALSSAALKQQTTKDNSENSYSESCIDSKTYSRPGSSEIDLSADIDLKSRSIKSDENQSRPTTSRTYCRSFVNTRSKIPVKIRSDRSRMSMTRFNETEKRVINHATSPTASRSLASRSSSPETHRFESERNSKSRGSSQFIKNYSPTDNERSTEVMVGYPVDTDSKEHERFSDRKSVDNKSENEEKSDLLSKDVQSRTSLCFQTRIEDDGSKEKVEIDDGDASSTNHLTEGNDISSSTSRSSIRSENSRKSDRTDEQNSLNRSVTSESNSPHETVTNVETVETFGDHNEKLDNFCSRISRTPRNSMESYRSKHAFSTYEGEIFEETTEERRTSLFENQIGDGGYQSVPMEDSMKFELASEMEESARGKRAAENRDKHRFSLEKLAADQFRRNISTEQAKSIQSDTATFFGEKFYEIPQFSLACSSSTSRLRRDKSRDSPRTKKKSQDRFPFTISEKTSIASMKFKVPGRLGNLDEDEEDRSYRLDMHPSITRLAGSGFEDSPADIISYVARTELEDRYVKSTGMKGLVQKFSARWKKPKKYDDRAESSAKSTSVIYKNRDYREECESSVESCSESSLLREFKVYKSLEEKQSKSVQNPDSPDENSSVIYSKHSSNRESSKNVSSTNAENPCRRYDRDDLWVQAFKDFDSDREEDTKDLEKEMDESKSKDPYSVFFVKSSRDGPETSAKPFLPKDEKKMRNVSTEKQKNRVKFRSTSLIVTPERSDEKVGKESARNRGSERVRKSRKNMQSGCFCLRFYRMIVPISFASIFKYRSRINNSSSIKKRSRISLQKKKG